MTVGFFIDFLIFWLKLLALMSCIVEGDTIEIHNRDEFTADKKLELNFLATVSHTGLFKPDFYLWLLAI